jgi:hypothetical protein
METCADCGKPIEMNQASYYRRDPATDIGKTYHSTCGDPFGIKAELARLREIEQAARDLTALWQEQKIAGLPRAQRNAAIEESRERLIALLNDGITEQKATES